MDVSGAQQWWHEWQLRILVLGSLFTQFFLCFCATLRRLAIPSWIRSLIWLAYVGGDALAIYAIATILNRHKEQTTTDGGSSALELLWAPVLLIHLGGQSNITAYSLEDHLLWKQHAIIVVSKVTVALYVFIKWWSGEKKLLQAAVVLFIFGIVKFAEKPWSLWRDSYDKVVASVAASPPSIEQDELPLEEYVQEATKYVQQDEVRLAIRLIRAEYGEKHFHLKMFADLPAPYSRRLKELRSIMEREDVYGMLHKCHRHIFNLLYTKAAASRILPLTFKVVLTTFLSTLFNFSLVLISAAVFTQSDKDDYSQNDVKVTYILLWCTTALELVPFFDPILDVTRRKSWDGMVSQYNLMCFSALKKKPTILMKLATFNCVRKYFYEHWYIGQQPAAVEITELVREHVKDGWNKYIHNTTSYRVFNNCRGQWTLHRLAWDTDIRQRLGRSLKVPFDESVLLWHIATDLCFHHPKSSPQDRQEAVTQRSREISNYMFYLLSICPEMLMPGTRPVLSTAASTDIELILKDSKAPLNDEEMLAQEIIESMKPATTSTEIGGDEEMLAQEITDRMKPTITKTETGTLIPNACRLAEALMELGSENERWQVIQGVWVEMLCYSAARCRGYLHAKSLGDGGEYLSYVWLLWCFMGMETLADKMQRPEPPREEEIAAAGAPASPSHDGVDQTLEIISSHS